MPKSIRIKHVWNGAVCKTRRLQDTIYTALKTFCFLVHSDETVLYIIRVRKVSGYMAEINRNNLMDVNTCVTTGKTNTSSHLNVSTNMNFDNRSHNAILPRRAQKIRSLYSVMLVVRSVRIGIWPCWLQTDNGWKTLNVYNVKVIYLPRSFSVIIASALVGAHKVHHWFAWPKLL